MNVLDIVVAVLVLGGSALALTAAIGVVRFPDTLTRMHAALEFSRSDLGHVDVPVERKAGSRNRTAARSRWRRRVSIVTSEVQITS